MSRRPGLRLKFIRAISILVALVLLANAGLMWLLARSYLKEDIEARGNAYGRLAAGAICEDYEAYYQSGYSKFRERLRGILDRNEDLAAIHLYDTGGRQLFHSAVLADPLYQPTVGGGEAVEDPALLAAIQSLTPGPGVVVTGAEGEAVYRVVVPYVEDWGRHRYSVAFDFSYQRLWHATGLAALFILLLSAASLALGVFFARLLAAGSLEPLRLLIQGAKALAAGHLERKVELRTGDEFETLAGTLNGMADNLHTSMGQLEASNRALLEANEELRQLDRLKSDLLANVSHELRTPLTAIKGYAEAMGDGLAGPVSEGQERALGVIQRNIQRLHGMIEQLLSFSRLESGRSRVERYAFDLGAVVEQAAETLRGASLGTRHLEVVRPAEGPLLAHGDPDGIAEVLDNLLSNAAKFTGEAGHITVRLEPAAEHIAVVVEDDGVGIPEEKLERIFERFYQVDASSRRSAGGMGLGLAIAREILELHGTELEVESTPGQGTTFRFALPRAAAEAPGALDAEGARERSGRRRVLLIDDDPGFTGVVGHFLERRGFAVDQATSAEEGWRRARRSPLSPGGPPDAILLDRLLPDADGFDLLARLKGDPRTAAIPVLVISIRREKALGLRLGASGYLVKPVDPERLLRAVDQVLAPDGHRPKDGQEPARILVVDDEPDLRDLLSARLLEGGYRVDTAAAGPEALEMIDEAVPDLLLLDLMMPGMDGWEMLRRLRSRPATANLPVIVVTARDTREDRRTGRELQVLETVTKPFDLAELVAEIERTLTDSEPRNDNTGDRDE